MNEEMMKAYRAAQRIVAEEMPEADREILRGIKESDTVIVRGCYDRVEDVLSLAGIPFRLVDETEVGRLALEPRQLLIVNCPGQIERSGITTIREFVRHGGSLLTTDWALENVLEPAFPGYVKYNERPTADDVVRIVIRDVSHPLLQGLFHQGADPLWWLEGSSYPIRILDHEKVKILLTSEELEAKYGEAPVAVTFTFGEGEVLHMISHYYLQRAELRTSRHKSGWKEYASEVGLKDMAAAPMEEFDGLSLGQVEAAHKSLKLMTNWIVDKQRKNRQRDNE